MCRRKGWGELAGGYEEFDPEIMEQNKRAYNGRNRAKPARYGLRSTAKRIGILADLTGLTDEVARLRSLPYEEYLKTEHWLKTAYLARQRDGNECRYCASRKPPLQVHHLTYERLGEERLSDVITLCRRCHEMQHGRKA